MRSTTLNKLNWLAACAAVHVVFFVAISSANTVNIIIPMLALNAFVVAVTSSFGMIYMQDLMPLIPSTATALFFNTSRIGSVLSGVMSGALIGWLGYRGTFLVCGSLSLGALILFSVSIVAERSYRSVVN
jgi:SET family sugar efflux transporter-like MFS transporter